MSRIEELKALEKAATAGPWIVGSGHDDHHYFDGIIVVLEPPRRGYKTILASNGNFPEQGHIDEAMVVAARNSLPALLEIASAAKEYVADSNARRDNYRRLAYCTELAAALAKLEATDAK